MSRGRRTKRRVRHGMGKAAKGDPEANIIRFRVGHYRPSENPCADDDMDHAWLSDPENDEHAENVYADALVCPDCGSRKKMYHQVVDPQALPYCIISSRRWNDAPREIWNDVSTAYVFLKLRLQALWLECEAVHDARSWSHSDLDLLRDAAELISSEVGMFSDIFGAAGQWPDDLPGYPPPPRLPGCAGVGDDCPAEQVRSRARKALGTEIEYMDNLLEWSLRDLRLNAVNAFCLSMHRLFHRIMILVLDVRISLDLKAGKKVEKLRSTRDMLMDARIHHDEL